MQNSTGGGVAAGDSGNKVIYIFWGGIIELGKAEYIFYIMRQQNTVLWSINSKWFSCKKEHNCVGVFNLQFIIV